MVAEFNPQNAIFALSLASMGARIKWVSNDKLGYGADDETIAEAVAKLTEGKIEPYLIKRTQKGESYSKSFWSWLIRSLIWKKREQKIPKLEENKELKIEYGDFLFDPDGIAVNVINEALKLEKNNYKLNTSVHLNKEISQIVWSLIRDLRKMGIKNLWSNISDNFKAVLTESSLAHFRLKEMHKNGL